MATVFQKKLAAVALGAYEKFHLLRENQEPLLSQVEQYWKATVGGFPGINEPWSAVFISWCVKQAGATSNEFTFASGHSVFVFHAIANTKNQTGVFHGRNPGEYAPKVGDILQNNRLKNSFDFAYASTHKNYKSHSAIVIETGSDQKGRYLRTVGGNENDSVGMKEVRLNKNGIVINTTGLYISVIETHL